jgi:hypothetical protein
MRQAGVLSASDGQKQPDEKGEEAPIDFLIDEARHARRWLQVRF